MRLPAVILAVFLLGSAPALADGPGDVVRRYLTLAYEGRFDVLPKAPDARTEQFERQVRNVLRVRCIRPDAITVSVAGETAMNADVVIEKSERRGDWSAVDFVPLRLELVCDGERWLVAAVINRDEEFADRLLQARGEERERLLREQPPERVSKGLVRALYARVLAYLNTAAFDVAGDVIAFALRIAAGAGDRGGESLLLASDSYVHLGNAGRLTEQSLAIAETLGDPDILARAWYDRGRNIGVSRFAPGYSGKGAMYECFRKARLFAERAEDPTILVRILYSHANAAANSQADYLTARRLVDEALPIAREAGDSFGEMGLESVLTTIYLGQGDQERGLFHNARATEMAEKLKAFAHLILVVRSGCLLVDQGRYDEARAMFARVLTRNAAGEMKSLRPVPANVIGIGLRSMAKMEAQSGNLSEAECLNREAAHFHGGGPNVYLYELAPYFSKKGNERGALALSMASLAQRGLYPDQQAEALIAAGRAYQRVGRFRSGLQLALEAIELREEIDARIAGGEDQRALAARTTSEAYELAAELTLEAGDPIGALAFLERGRARVLTDILTNGRPGSMAEADSEAREQEAALDREVARISAELDHARDPKRIGELTEQLRLARDGRASFLDGLRARSERWNVTRQRIDAGAIRGLGTRLPPRTAAIEYFAAEHDLHIFVAGADGVAVRTRHVERKVLDERVSAFLDMLAHGDLRTEKAGRELYSLLIAPVEKDIAGAEALLVVPDGGLWRVPFAALVDRGGKFLVERRAIVYAPSVTAYASIAGSHRHRESRAVSLFAVGNPTKDAAESRIAASFYRSAGLGPLPDAEREVDAVRTLYHAARSVVLKRDQATEARTKAGLRDATIAHFATHAIFDDANPMYSKLMLARGPEAAEDGWLESWEVARLSLDADLVVLSACETARGRVGGGEGVVGLAWSFFLAGASSTVATQWKVASDSTARFMIAFHSALRAPAVTPALHKAQSLREAQLQFIHDPRTHHPFHWAPFVLLGDPAVTH